MSLRASVTSQLTFEDCAIPEANTLPGADGLKGPLQCLNQARYGIAWGALGAGMACYHAALEYAKARIQFGRPIASFQLVQEKLVYMLSEITKGQLLALQLGRLKDAGKLHYTQTSLAKRNNVAIALETARLAREILGANGISLEFPVIRHMCNLESVKTYEGTHDIHTLILGQAITDWRRLLEGQKQSGTRICLGRNRRDAEQRREQPRSEDRGHPGDSWRLRGCHPDSPPSPQGLEESLTSGS